MKTAKLFIRGSREPIEITYEQGVKANQIKKGEGEYSELNDKDTISIGDIWTGEKGDLRYVKFENTVDPAQETVYTARELFLFEEELKPYFIKEGDDEYNWWVNKFVDEITDVHSRLSWSKTTKEMLLKVREDIDTFPDLETWMKDGVDAQKEDESDEDYEKRVRTVYDPSHMAVLKKELIENKDKVEEGAEGIVRMKMVGTLPRSGEERYLIEQNAIKIDEKGGLTILRHRDGSILYKALSHKLSRYAEWKSQREYASGKEMEGYAEMAGHLADDKTISYEESGGEEPF